MPRKLQDTRNATEPVLTPAEPYTAMSRSATGATQGYATFETSKAIRVVRRRLRTLRTAADGYDRKSRVERTLPDHQTPKATWESFPTPLGTIPDPIKSIYDEK